jgi:C4-dicarboxylate transporter
MEATFSDYSESSVFPDYSIYSMLTKSKEYSNLFISKSIKNFFEQQSNKKKKNIIDEETHDNKIMMQLMILYAFKIFRLVIIVFTLSYFVGCLFYVFSE